MEESRIHSVDFYGSDLASFPLMLRGHLLCLERQSKQSALFLITVVTFLKYSLSPPSTADYEAGKSDIITVGSQITNSITFQQISCRLRQQFPKRAGLLLTKEVVCGGGGSIKSHLCDLRRCSRRPEHSSGMEPPASCNITESCRQRL